MTFLTILGVEEICSFWLVLEERTGKDLPEPPKLEFLENVSANNFALSDAKDSTSGLLNRGVIADLPFLRTLLTIHQKPQEPRLWEVTDSFVLVGVWTLFKTLVACLNFTLDSEGLMCW